MRPRELLLELVDLARLVARLGRLLEARSNLFERGFEVRNRFLLLREDAACGGDVGQAGGVLVGELRELGPAEEELDACLVGLGSRNG